MTPYVLYYASGKIHMSSYQQGDLDIVVPSDMSYLYTDMFIETVNDYYVRNQQLLQKPARTYDYQEWDYTTAQWVNSSEEADRLAKTKREKLLTSSDWTDTYSAPVRLGQTLYDAWQIYRQALRDITTQSGYPFSVTWPTEP